MVEKDWVECFDEWLKSGGDERARDVEKGKDYAVGLAKDAYEHAFNQAKLNFRLEMDTHLRIILGKPNFMCVPIFTALRRMGQEIPSKAEAEQAHSILWMLNLYFEHGDAWSEEGEKILTQALKEKQDEITP
jgi:hypothetical protein